MSAALSAPAVRRVGPLSRDGRDTLFLLAVMAWTVAPHFSRLPLWCSAFAIVALLWRAQLARRDAPLPGRFVLAALLAGVVGLTWWSHRNLLGQEPGVTLVVALTALKTLELRARRDAFVVFFMGFFLVLTQFLYSQSLLTALAMVAAVWGLLTALVLAHLPVGRPPLREAATVAGRAALIGVPIMVVLFMLFPRIGPLWGRPDDGLGTTGLSGRMRMGDVAEIALDDSVAMRVRFLGRVPPPQALYFRGPVLTRFDGQQWRSAQPWQQAMQNRLDEPLRLLGTPVRYEITLEPTRLTTVPLLEATPEAPVVEGAATPMQLRPQGLWWQADQPLGERLRLQARAWPQFAYGSTATRLAAHEWGDLLALPPGHSPRTRAWAEALRQRLPAAGPRELADALLSHIQREPYTYTLAPGAYGAQPVDEFWLDRRLGFCEHYAASFVVILRMLGVPARVVTGYQGADRNPLDDTWIVRNSHAHAWAEYWEPGSGWVRADPTAAVAPERIERTLSLRPTPGVMAGALERLNPGWGNQLRNTWEAVNNGWNQWVLNYSRNTQFDLLKRLGVQAPDWTDLAYVLIGLFSVLSLGGAAWAWWSRTEHDPWLLAYAKVQARLRRRGLDVPAHWPPLTLAADLRRRAGSRAEALARALEAYDAQRYAPAPHPAPHPGPSKPPAAQRRHLLKLATEFAQQTARRAR